MVAIAILELLAIVRNCKVVQHEAEISTAFRQFTKLIASIGLGGNSFTTKPAASRLSARYEASDFSVRPKNHACFLE